MAQAMRTARDRALDEWLVLGCQAGDRRSFDLLIRRWQRRLWSYARRLTGCDEAAWDIVQETWMAVLRRIQRLDDPAWFPAWVYRIVRNRCADHARRSGRQRNLVAAAAAERQRHQVDEAGQRAVCEEVSEALRRLPPEARELLLLKYREGLSLSELAFVLGVPPGTVKSRLFHARERLRQVLEGERHEQAG